MFKERDYQEAACEKTLQWFEKNSGNPLIAMPTGTGKSVVIAGLVKRVCMYPDQRIVKLTHSKVLIQQNFDKLLAIWPTAPAGIVSAGLKRKDYGFPITFAGIGSVYKDAHKFGKINICIVDEAHLISSKEKTMYRRFFADLKAINPKMKIIGLTATPFRVGLGLLTDEEDGIFDEISFNLCNMDAFNWLLDNGYLCYLMPKRTKTEIDVSNVTMQGQDFNQHALQAASDQEHITRACIKEALVEAADRNHWLVFCTGIAHVMNTVRIMREMGISTTYVHSGLTDKENDDNLADFLAGKYRAMVNNGILTTGFDYPQLDCIIMLRATKSPGLWVQMLGRGTRPFYLHGFDLETPEGRLQAIYYSSKQNCLVLDFAGNSRRLGPINDPKIPNKKGKKGGVQPVKECEPTIMDINGQMGCGCYNHPSVKKCVFCGWVFPVSNNLELKASSEELITRKGRKHRIELSIPPPVLEWFNVRSITFKENRRSGFDSYVEVTYHAGDSGLQAFKKMLNFEAEKKASRTFAREWWQTNAIDSNSVAPEDAHEAMKRLGELKQPSRIKVWTNDRYKQVMAYEFS